MKWCSRSLAPVALLVAACSGASEADVLGPATEQSSSPAEPSPTNGAAPSGGGGSSGTGGAGAGAADAGAADAGATCTREIEPNDDIDEATPFTSRLCGKIESRNDVDYATFEVPEDAQVLSYKYSDEGGRVALRVYVDGAPLPVTSGQIRVIPKATYQFELRLSQSGSSQDRPSYALEVVAK